MSSAEVAPRRILTDWTSSSGLAGDGLLALVAGSEVTAEGIHLATLGYEVFVLGSGDDLAHVYHVESEPAQLPAEWNERFGLVVYFGAGGDGMGGDGTGGLADIARLLALGGLLVLIADAGSEAEVVEQLSEGASSARREDTAESVRLTVFVSERRPDPDRSGAELVRIIAARLATPQVGQD